MHTCIVWASLGAGGCGGTESPGSATYNTQNKQQNTTTHKTTEQQNKQHNKPNV